MALRIHTGTRADALVGPLGDLLATPLADPMTTEVIGIPTHGMERWLSQQLAQRLGRRSGRADGVCANIDFLFLGSLVGRATATPDIDPEADPWRPERAVWPMIEVVDGMHGARWLESLAAHLGDNDTPDPDGVRHGRRYGVLRRVADLFDRYGMHRPEMITAWADGQDTDGQGTDLAAEFVWQARLWRALRARIGVASPAERLGVECARIRANPDAIALPPRLAIVGATRIPAAYLRVLDAVADARDVHAFLLYPSPALWNAVSAARRSAATGDLRRDDPTAAMARHPLLSSWGRDAREMQLLLGADHRMEAASGRVPGSTATLLARLQEDIRLNQAPVGPPIGDVPDDRAVFSPGDRSVQIHSCHGRTRQVEALRDAVLHVLRDDPTLEPRDIIVLCPDIEAFAPLIEATFGAGDRVGAAELGTGVVATTPTGLRVRIADRSLRETNPVLGAITRVLGLADQRVTATQLLELAALDPVRKRFGFTDDELAHVEGWVREAGIRWGLDAAGRAAFALDEIDANTWVAGLDRMLVGVAMSADDDLLVGGVLPLHVQDGASSELVGRLVEFVTRVRAVIGRFQTPAPVGAWVDALTQAADLLTASDLGDSWQRAQLNQILTSAAERAEGFPIELALKEVRSLFGAELRGRAGRASFRTGHLTVSSLVPMRGVPHRVVCLLGLDDGVFPSQSGRAGDDLTLGEPKIGDRDARSEDLQQLLDALMAAQDCLIVTFAGRNERTNVEQPPAVPVGELLDVVGRMIPTDPRGLVLIEHPLQPFDPRNFQVGALAADVVWSFDAVALHGAQALVAGHGTATRFLSEPLPARDVATLELASLVRFVERPVQEFLSARLGMRLRPLSDEIADALPLGLTGVEKWAVGDRMLAAALAGLTTEAWVATERARGTLPPGVLGDQLIDEIRPAADEIARNFEVCRAGMSPELVEIAVALSDGRCLEGTIPNVYGSQILSVSYSRLPARARLRAWVNLLALVVSDPTGEYRSVTIGRNTSGKAPAVAVARVQGLDAASARECLERLVGLYDDSMCRPPLIFPQTSAAYAAAYAKAQAKGNEPMPDSTTKSAWDGPYGSQVPGEKQEPAHKLILGGELEFADLWKVHGDRVGRSAVRLWGDLLDWEQITDA